MPFDLSTAQPVQQNNQNLTGEDFLKTLPPSAAAIVKKAANG